ncbi:MAG: O-antigen ligase domain-containing protein [Planctomycetota bacterium]|nr:MAG: O-antigen ligase domain-containing protein [Planctomycetota bacterium]REJ88449.1 MAG: O-antigen ligase domain-containing protein [Planctomycetota bacterium]REK22355.1 MAG: O-antigen ligase domain-containing protein [Planctomycetota bacterium]REK43598.1 MAG: O-antigen ligase domain-containing protein [Planctomycetota bacterium]
MLHFIEITLYVLLSGILILKATQRPIWGTGYYMLNFFAQPDYWAWGAPLTNPGVLRWSLYSSLYLLFVTLLQPSATRFKSDPDSKRASGFFVAMLINALFVHIAFAYVPEKSWEMWTLMGKYAVFYFLALATIRSARDFTWFLGFFALGLAYWGFEGKFVGVTLISGRLEKFGGPGCSNSNELASITATLLPLMGALIIMVRGIRRVIVAFGTALALNILMLANSRGGFVGLLVGAVTIPVVSTGRVRELALKGMALGALGAFLLAGNPEILTRFLSTFYSDSSARGQSALDEANKETRKVFWKAGLNMLADNPLGSGGAAFKSGKGNPYIAKQGLNDENRSCHQGFIVEAMSWGVQGLILRMGLVICAGLAALKTSRFRMELGDYNTAFAGACICGSFATVLVTSLFGDFLQMEWAIWICIVAVGYAKIFGKANYGKIPDAIFVPEEKKSDTSAPPSRPVPVGV